MESHSLPSHVSDRWSVDDIALFDRWRENYAKFIKDFDSMRLYNYTELDYLNNVKIVDILCSGNLYFDEEHTDIYGELGDYCEEDPSIYYTDAYDGVRKLVRSKERNTNFKTDERGKFTFITAFYIPECLNVFTVGIYGSSIDAMIEITNGVDDMPLDELLEKSKRLPLRENNSLRKSDELYLDGMIYKRYEIIEPFIDKSLIENIYVEFDTPSYLYTEIIHCGGTEYHLNFQNNWSNIIYFSKYLNFPLIMFNYYGVTEDEKSYINHREHDIYDSRVLIEWESDNVGEIKHTNII